MFLLNAADLSFSSRKSVRSTVLSRNKLGPRKWLGGKARIGIGKSTTFELGSVRILEMTESAIFAGQGMYVINHHQMRTRLQRASAVSGARPHV